MVWLQIIFFIVTNAPSLIRAIREIRESLRGDKEAGKAMLKEMKQAKRMQMKDGKPNKEAYAEIIEKYRPAK